MYVISLVNDHPKKVYAKAIGGSITNECENKIIYAKDYTHEAGTYEMSFCVDFTVEYNIEKTVCKKSNRYRI